MKITLDPTLDARTQNALGASVLTSWYAANPAILRVWAIQSEPAADAFVLRVVVMLAGPSLFPFPQPRSTPESSMSKILVLYYSMYGHLEHMARAVAEGAGSVAGSEVTVKRVPETMSAEALRAAGGKAEQAAEIATVAELPDYDAILFGTPTRFGNMAGQMRTFLDQTGGLWATGALVNKIGSVFTSTSTQHGGQETTLTSFHVTLLHHGMLIAGVPYTCAELTNMSEITGGSPYGAGTLAGPDGRRLPSANELAIARFQGAHVARLAARMQG